MSVEIQPVHSALEWNSKESSIPWWETQSLLPFKPCSSICISGTTGSGKTQWVYKLLKNAKGMFVQDPPETILYCYGVWQDLFEDMEEKVPGITFHEGLPNSDTLNDISTNGKHNIIVIDDLAHQLVKSSEMEVLFTQGCHHKKFSVIYITQNMFQKGQNARTITLNTWYNVVFRNLRDASQVNVLGRQMFPGRPKILQEAYENATGRPYGYLVIDNSPHSDSKYRLRTRVFPPEDPLVYIPRV